MAMGNEGFFEGCFGEFLFSCFCIFLFNLVLHLIGFSFIFLLKWTIILAPILGIVSLIYLIIKEVIENKNKQSKG